MISDPAIVIDASAAASWLLPGETGGACQEILNTAELRAPVLSWAGMRNFPVISERRERPAGNMVSEAVSMPDALKVNFENSPDAGRVLQLAREHDLTVCDAPCVELALRLQIPLLTHDRKLAAVAVQESIPARQPEWTVRNDSCVDAPGPFQRPRPGVRTWHPTGKRPRCGSSKTCGEWPNPEVPEAAFIDAAIVKRKKNIPPRIEVQAAAALEGGTRNERAI